MLVTMYRHITISVNNQDLEEQDLRLITLGVYPEMTIEVLRSSIEAEGIPAPTQHLYHNGQLITDNAKTLQELQIVDGDMLALHVRDMRGTNMAPSQNQGQGAQRGSASGGASTGAGAGAGGPLSQDPEVLRLHILGDPAQRRQLERLNPGLAAVIEDPQRFAQFYQQSANQQEQARLARIRQIEALNADEFNPEAQAKIADMIREESVRENLQNAMEHNPECTSSESPFANIEPAQSWICSHAHTHIHIHQSTPPSVLFTPGLFAFSILSRANM
jgi:DNA damage-inducible protein 1